jgi:hypothetical protein
MKNLLTLLLFMIQSVLFAQLEIDQIDLYKQIVFNVHNQSDNSIGTAFIVGKSETHFYLATAKHVLNGQKEMLLTSIDGVKHQASLVREHDVYDFAILRTPLFLLQQKKIPIITDISMNNEVSFVSAKDLGKIFPIKGNGIVRDVTEESISAVMNNVNPGHSGSPLLSKNRIAGIILKNGNFIECLNILLIKKIIDAWGDQVFYSIFEEQRAMQITMQGQIPILDTDLANLKIVKVTSANVEKDLMNLVDGKLETRWSYYLEPNKEIELLLQLSEFGFVGSFKFHISEKFSNFFPNGTIYFIDKKSNKIVYTNFSSIFKQKMKSKFGYWFIYHLPDYESATEIRIHLKNDKNINFPCYFNEIQFYGK